MFKLEFRNRLRTLVLIIPAVCTKLPLPVLRAKRLAELNKSPSPGGDLFQGPVDLVFSVMIQGAGRNARCCSCGVFLGEAGRVPSISAFGEAAGPAASGPGFKFQLRSAGPRPPRTSLMTAVIEGTAGAGQEALAHQGGILDHPPPRSAPSSRWRATGAGQMDCRQRLLPCSPGLEQRPAPSLVRESTARDRIEARRRAPLPIKRGRRPRSPSCCSARQLAGGGRGPVWILVEDSG